MVHGTGYLDHCQAQVERLFSNKAPIAFVPFALHDTDAYRDRAADRFRQMGLDLVSVHDSTRSADVIRSSEGIFIGGGNTFRLLRAMYRYDLLEAIRHRVSEGTPYMGTSAGSNVAGPTIRTTNDMPIVEPPSFDALGLVPFQINPHYLDPDPSSTHMGETRDQRLAEFLEDNDGPVVALREGAMLLVEADSVALIGKSGGKLFHRGSEPQEIHPGRLDLP